MQSLLSLLGLSRPVIASPAPQTPIGPSLLLVVPNELTDLLGEPGNEPFEAQPPVSRVTATELWHQFDANEADAERRFSHRPLYVSGAVDCVSREGANYVVKLSVSGALFETVRCRVAEGNRFNVEQLRRGDLVMVLGPMPLG